MSFQATTRASILRGVLVDPLGDELDANAGSPVAGYGDLPASIIQRSKQVFDPATGTRRTVRYYIGRLPGNVELQEGDRIKDNRTGEVFTINESTVVPRTLAGTSSLTLDLSKTASP